MAARRSRSEPPELLTSRAVARLLNVAIKTRFRLAAGGLMPPLIRLSERILRWRVEDSARFLRRAGGKSS